MSFTCILLKQYPTLLSSSLSLNHIKCPVGEPWIASKMVQPFAIDFFSKLDQMFNLSIKRNTLSIDGLVGSPLPPGNNVGNAMVSRYGV